MNVAFELTDSELFQLRFLIGGSKSFSDIKAIWDGNTSLRTLFNKLIEAENKLGGENDLFGSNDGINKNLFNNRATVAIE